MAQLQTLHSLLAQGLLSRREFLRRAALLGATATAASVLPGAGARAAQARTGGHFRIGLGAGSNTDSLDPAGADDAYDQLIIHTMHNHLTEVDASGEAVPDLAQSIDASPDARVWTVKLPSGVTFHNGKELDAGDVIASYNHHRGASGSAAGSLLQPLQDISSDGKHTVVFTLREGNADFPYIMSDYHLAILPARDGRVQGSGAIGLGAYRNTRYQPGVQAEFERNPDYWKPGVGHFDSVQVRAIKDTAARTNALTTGEIDAMDRCDLSSVHLLKRNPAVRVEEVAGTQHYALPMNTASAPFDDNNVRMALKFAIDREALVKTVLRGYGRPANDHPISPANKYFHADLAAHSYDPERARGYLKQAGLTSLKVELSAAEAAFPGAVDSALLYRQQAAAAGIDIRVVRESDDNYWSRVWMKKNWCMSYWGGRPSEDWMFSIAYARGANWNDTSWDHTEFNRLLLAARPEFNTGKRREIYREMQNIVANQGGALIPMYASYVFATASRVGHAGLASNWDLDGNKAAVRWWFAG